MTSLCLIDANNLLYRAFYALPRLTAPDGTPTNAAFGFARVLLKILREDRPDAVAVVFDAPGPTARHALYPEYKANRLKVPEDLAAQIPLVKELVDALGVPRIEESGVEADDVIGTLSREAEASGMEVVIVSSDKDLYQLVSDRVRVRDGIRERTVGSREVEETFGVPPSRIVDLLALAGDPSDNVPGVPGIGEKTAAGLIREFGSLEEVLMRAAEIPGSRGKRIREHAGAARLSGTLARIDREVALPLHVADLAPKGIRAEPAALLFLRLGFRRILEELGIGGDAVPPAPVASPPAPPCRELDTAQELSEAGGREADSAGLFDPGEEGEPAAVFLPGRGAFALPPPELAAAAREFGRRGATLYLVDGKGFLRRRIGREASREPLPLFDLQVAGYLLAPDEGTQTLEKLSARHLGGATLPTGGTPAERGGALAMRCHSLGEVLSRALRDAGLEPVFRELEMPLLPVLLRMEERGIRLDPAVFAGLSGELAAAAASIEERVRAQAGEKINLNSPKQLAALLFERLGLPPVKRTKTGFSTDVDVLEQLRNLHEIPALVLEYRTLAKLRSTYVDVLPGMVDPRDGRIHTTFHQTQAATGRLSSSDPNLQNIPIRTGVGLRIREGFVAGPGRLFVGADYSQVELRLLAHLSGDPELSRSFHAGEDIHAATARAVFGVSPPEVTPEQRRRAKVINFGILYGMSPFGLSRELSIPPREAREYIDQYFSRYRGVREYIDRVLEGARRDGYVQTLSGRRRPIRDINSRNKVLREAAERMAVNSPIQGSAADLVKEAMIRVDRTLHEEGLEAGLVLQVHDELVVETPRQEAERAQEILRTTMEGVARLSVPLVVSVAVGENWGQIH